MRRCSVLLALLGSLVLSMGAADADSDPRAVALAEAVMERLGGRTAWDTTRFVRWNFFGKRMHYWDKHTGDVRIEIPERRSEDGKTERPELFVLMNVGTRQGRVWAAGQPVADETKLREYLDLAHQVWINDSYWMFMPYKLLDPGVTLRYAGERKLEDGRGADVLELTFAAGVGYTPENRYEVFVSRDTGLVEQWAFFAQAASAEPQFTMPWAGWRQFGSIWLATDHGQGQDWSIAVDEGLLRAFFTEGIAPAR